MKISIYINETSKQINLIPEDKYESDIIKDMTGGKYDVKIINGTFGKYEGYNKFYSNMYDEDELILIIEKNKED